jgi:hypothetical protein
MKKQLITQAMPLEPRAAFIRQLQPLPRLALTADSGTGLQTFMPRDCHACATMDRSKPEAMTKNADQAPHESQPAIA